MIRLSNVFSDWMVLQRDTFENMVWGYAEPDSYVSITLAKNNPVTGEAEIEFEGGVTIKNGDGYFEIVLRSFPAGGDYTLTVSDSKDAYEFKHITFGDVFVCGGQSNMELPLNRTLERYEEEIINTCDTDIRFFRVPEKYNFHGTEEMIENGSWKYAKMPEILDFGAVAYFTAQEIKNREGVPVGIYNTAIGGTPIKSWVGEKTMRALGLHEAEYEECKNDAWVKETIETEAKADMAWREDADKSFDADLSGNLSGTFSVPGFFEGTPLGGKCLAVLFKKEFTLPEGWTEDEVKLYLGAIIDSDKVYVNGQYVGETGYLYPPRIYRIPKGVLKTGLNTIEIKLLVFRREGGFMPGKEYQLKRPDGETVSLSGDWEYTVAKEMPYIENLTFFSYKATGVYNCMIYPLRRQQCRGFFFYQGESNVDDYATYKDEFEAVIKDWRHIWRDDTLPFMFVQIAGFSDGNRKAYFGRRSFFTEEQRKCTELPGTALIQAYDLGEFNDLHPTNKKEVGRRGALAAESLVYGRGAYVPGPEMKEVIWKDGGAEVVFSEKLILSHGYGVITGPDRDEKNIIGFEYISDGRHIAAEAEFTAEDRVFVKFPADVKIEALTYAWTDSPLDANLYSEDRLPVVPFYVNA